MRDGKGTRSKSIERRRQSMRRVFKALKRGGDPARRTSSLAWDFTVASREVDDRRHAAHARRRPSRGSATPTSPTSSVQGDSPAFTVTKNESAPPEDTEIARVVEGTVAVPCFLESDGCAVGARLHRGADGLPAQKPGNTYTAFFRCVIPRDLPAGGGRALHLRPRPARRPAGLRRLRAGQLKTLAARRASPSAAPTGAGSPPPTATRTRCRPPRRSRTSRASARSPTGCSRGCSTICSSAARWSRRTACAPPGVRGRVRRDAAALLRRQLAGRDQRRRAHRGRARLRPRRARRAGHELLDAAAALGRLRAVPRRARRVLHRRRSTAR